jgi:DNA-binding NarL/FixJ family response regulator
MNKKHDYSQQLKDWKARRQSILKQLAKGKTQSEVARSLGISRQAVSQMVRKESFAK